MFEFQSFLKQNDFESNLVLIQNLSFFRGTLGLSQCSSIRHDMTHQSGCRHNLMSHENKVNLRLGYLKDS